MRVTSPTVAAAQSSVEPTEERRTPSKSVKGKNAVPNEGGGNARGEGEGPTLPLISHHQTSECHKVSAHLKTVVASLTYNSPL